MQESREAFFAALDAVIIGGLSTPKTAQQFAIGEMTVRKRKRLLRERGLLNNYLQPTWAEVQHADTKEQ